MKSSCKLSDVVDVQSGFAFRSQDYTDSGSFLIRIGNVQDGYLSLDSPKFVQLDERTKRFALNDGDILTSLTGNIGRVARVSTSQLPAALNQRVARILVRKPNELSADYLFRFLTSRMFQLELEDAGHGVAQRNVSPAAIGEINIPLPPLAEQRRIVAILDEAFAGLAVAVENTKRNLASARELFERELNRVFSEGGEGWEEKRLGEVCSIDSTLVDPRKAEFRDLPHIGAGNMVSKTGQVVNVLTAEAEGLKSGKYLFDERMVLYSKIRPYLEKVCVAPFVGLCSADVYPLMPNGGVLVRGYLYYALTSRHFIDYAISGSARAGMPKVNRDHLFDYRLALPSKDDQFRLVELLKAVHDEAMKLERHYHQKLAALSELKQSLLQKAFAGELTADFVDGELVEVGA